MDSQQVEIAGKSILTSLFVSENIEVAKPVRDKGIDLIIYSNKSSDKFNAIPIQLKASTNKGFSIDSKYAKFPNLHMAYVWNVGDPQKSEIFIISYQQAVQLTNALTKYFTKHGNYAVTRPSKKFILLISKFRHEAGNMSKLVEAM